MLVRTKNISVFVDAVYAHLSTLKNRNTFGVIATMAGGDDTANYMTRLTRQPTVDDWDNIETELQNDTEFEELDLVCYADGTFEVELYLKGTSASSVFEALAKRANELSMPEDA